MPRLSRRTFLAAAAGTAACGFAAKAAPTATARRLGTDLHGEFGITTGSFMKHLHPNASPKFVMLELPKIMRDELDLKVIDLMTKTIPYRDADYCARFRDAAEKAGRVITNLKLNLDANAEIGSADETIRRRSLEAMKEGIDAAQRLGCRWVRPATTDKQPDRKLLTDALRELIDYAAPKNITLLIENNGWIQSDADALPQMVLDSKEELAVQPDTGNWKPDVRYEGLEKAFAYASSCDFKALKLGPNMEHAEYDLRRCFDIAWQSGFRGPWCFEHFDDDLSQLLKNFVRLREQLQAWIKQYPAK